MSIDFLTQNGANSEELANGPLQKPFAEGAFAFLAALSEALLDPEIAKSLPEITALGFWLRRANLAKLKQEYWHPNPNAEYAALGTVVHIAPANVDTMFVYSWVCSLLMGNRNIVRVSSRRSEVVDRLIVELNKLFERNEFKALGHANAFVRYEHDENITESLSAMADARVIWGGDETVKRIRAIPAKPTTRDIAFADKYSVTVINGDEVEPNCVESLAERLWRDTHPYNQMACSSPKVIFWLGSQGAQATLFDRIDQLAAQKQSEQGANEHLVAAQSMMVESGQNQLRKLGAIGVLASDSVGQSMLRSHPGGGFFILIQASGLDQVFSQLNEKCQTLTSFGIPPEALVKHLQQSPINGVVRAVPCGQALDFVPVWDGYDLFGELSRALLVKA